MHAVSSRVRIAATAVAEESDLIHSPLDRPQVVESVEDGAWVGTGATIVRFDASLASNEWLRLSHQRRISDAELAMRLTDQDNRMSELSDRLQAARDRLAVEEARLEALLSLPDTNAVHVATGRARVERLTCYAASNAWVRAGQRLTARLISPAAYARHQSVHDRAQARSAHAEAHRHLAARGASPLQVERARLIIDNLRLELTNLTVQTDDTRQIVALQKQAARMRARALDQQVRDQEEALRNVRVTAPRDGYVSYARDFVRRFSGGTERMWRKYQFARMPHAETLVLRGPVDEAKRRFFTLGDPVEVRFVGRLGEAIPGHIAAISAQPRDRAEREEAGWGGPGEYGVKVYDVTIALDRRPAGLRLGMHAECELRTARPLDAPAVPAEYLINRDGQGFLIADGRLRPVTGTVVEGLFVLADTNLLGAVISLRLPETQPGAARPAETLFETAGELAPAETTDVVIRRIYGWQKIAWLIPENTVVTAGTVVATLDDRETHDQLAEAERRLQEAASNREAQEQSRAILLRQNQVLLATGSNTVRIAELDLALARMGADAGALADARLQARLAEIDANERGREAAAVARRSADLASEKERVGAARAARKAALLAEQARLRLRTLEALPDALEIARLASALEDARSRQAAAARKSGLDALSTLIDLERSRRYEGVCEQQRVNAGQNLTNLCIRAPCDGLVRYRRMWSNSGYRKAAAGAMVSTGFTPLTIASRGRMEARAEVPERFFTHVYPGRRVLAQIPAVSDAFYPASVTAVEPLFQERKPKSGERGLYSNHETLGETVFTMRVAVDPDAAVPLQAGAAARLVLPLDDRRNHADVP